MWGPQTLVLKWNSVSQGRKIQPRHVPNFQELGFKGGPSFIRQNRSFATPIQDGGFLGLETFISDWSWERIGLTRKEESNRCNQAPRNHAHIKAGILFLILSKPQSVSKPGSSNVFGLPIMILLPCLKLLHVISHHMVIFICLLFR
jgi:hypothetical protein